VVEPLAEASVTEKQTRTRFIVTIQL